MSVYGGEAANFDELYSAVTPLPIAFKNCFKKQEEWQNFVSLLITLMLSENFTKKRAEDAVMNYIKNCKMYAQINISEILSYDKGVKEVTYEQLLRMYGRTDSPFVCWIGLPNGDKMRVLLSDALKHNLNIIKRYDE